MRKLACNFILALLLGVGANFALAQVKTATAAKKNTPQPKPKDKKPRDVVNVYFDFNSFEIKGPEADKLEKFVEALKKQKDYILFLQGHTDSTGKDDYNLKLSENRVMEVYDFFAQSGIDTSVMRVSFFGAKKLKERGATEEKAKLNRRVEVSILEPEEKKPLPKPPAPKDTCNKDTIVTVGSGITMKLNYCEYVKLASSQKNKKSNISVTAITEIDEIMEAEVAKTNAKKDGHTWAGIYTVKISGDTCLKKPASFTFTLDGDIYKKPKFTLYKSKEDVLEIDKKTKVISQPSKDKSTVKVTVPFNCGGQFCIAFPNGKSNEAKFKDKTKSIEEMYVVSGAPNVILPAVKKGKKFYVYYNNVPGAKLYIKTSGGETWIKDIDLNTIKKSKEEGKLAKKYKIKRRHLSSANSGS